jgi:Uma2 family endonuclease
MSAPVSTRMTADAFIARAMQQPEGRHYELAAGEIVAMAPERLAHGRTKERFARRLADATEAARLGC